MAGVRAIAVMVCLVATWTPSESFMAITSVKVVRLSARRCSSRGQPALRSLRLSAEGNEGEGERSNKRWSVSVVDEAAERIESVKVALLSSLSGSLAMAPLAVIEKSSFYPSDAFSAQWELAHDGLAFMLALFGLVYSECCLCRGAWLG